MHGSESDVAADKKIAGSRDTGGLDEQEATDATSTTGVDRNEEFVGRVAGDDPAYAGETGAEARANGAEGS